MQELLQPTSLFHSSIRPRLESLDSAEEFGIEHWMHVCMLVDQADMPASGVADELPAEFERAMEETMLEVESAAAN